MKKLQISGKEFIRTDGLYYNLTDLFRLTTLGGIRLEPWGWAQSENRTRDISRRGWFFKKSWAKAAVLIEYAHYLSPGLYRDVLRAVNMDDEDKLIAVFGELKAARLDLRVQEIIDKRKRLKAASSVIVTKVDRKVEPFLSLDDIPPFRVEDLPKATPQPARRQPTTSPQTVVRDRKTGRIVAPTRSMSHSRSMGSSVTHHRSEPDYLTQAMLTQAVVNSWDDSSHRSSHHSSSSWSGDSGGSYDSGSSGGCGD